MRFSVVDGFNKVEIMRWAKAHLTPKSIVNLTAREKGGYPLRTDLSAVLYYYYLY